MPHVILSTCSLTLRQGPDEHVENIVNSLETRDPMLWHDHLTGGGKGAVELHYRFITSP